MKLRSCNDRSSEDLTGSYSKIYYRIIRKQSTQHFGVVMAFWRNNPVISSIIKCTQFPIIIYNIFILTSDIVFFGESLPERFGKLAGKVFLYWFMFSHSYSLCHPHFQDTQECDLLIVMGTSLAVQPFATLASRYIQSCVVLVNYKYTV